MFCFRTIATAHVTVDYMALHMREVFCQTNRAAGLAKTWTLASCLDEEGGNKGAKEGVRRIPKPWLQTVSTLWVDEQGRTDD